MSKQTPSQRKLAKKIAPHDAGLERWTDWQWQLKHSIRDIETLEKLLGIRYPDDEREKLLKTLEKFPLSITPYYLSLINVDDFRNDPIYKQAFPHPAELILERREMSDPLAEDHDSPVPGIVHRYPDRVLFLVSNVCSMYCRHCTRKRKVGDVDCIPSPEIIEQGLAYLRDTPQVRDVLLSGGDPLLLSDDHLDWILTEVQKIPHVQIVRIGSRTPVVLPYRITDQLVAMLKKHHPLYFNTHFNHPREITASSREALAKLADAGIPLGNQTVLMAGVNDCPRIIKALFHRLLENRVRPYYLFQCDLTEGLAHFRTPIGKGMEIMESLIGHTSGLAVPTYVVDAPGGGGKIPLNPNYLISLSTNKVVLRNFEGVITTYKEPDSYEPIFCDRQCDKCVLQLPLEEAEEYRASGVEMLLSDDSDTISLTPEKTERLERRDQD
jgi:lysine 2,3-aminomutase